MMQSQMQCMPFRGEKTAPIFDRTQPSSLRQYFAQLETLFARCGITDDLEKKTHVTPYLECDLADQWEALREFSDHTKTYADFKACLFELYNLNITRYTLCDLAQLVSDHFRSGMPTLQALSQYHLEFNSISSHLLRYDLLSCREQSQMYLEAFDTSLQSRIEFRLQVQFPHHAPSLAYPIESIFEAARWILRDLCVPSTAQVPVACPIDISIPERVSGDVTTTPALTKQSAMSSASNSAFVKAEDLVTALRDISKTIINARSHPSPLRATHMQPEHPSTPVTSTAVSAFMMTTTASPSMPIIPMSLCSDSSSPSNHFTTLSTPTTPRTVQTRILAIEEELHVLRAQRDNTTMPSTPIRRAKHSEVMDSPPTPPRRFPSAKSSPVDHVRDFNTPCAFAQLSSIVNPATFAYRGRLYQAIKWTPGTRTSTTPLIPAARTAQQPSTSHRPLSIMLATHISTPPWSEPSSTIPNTSISHSTALQTHALTQEGTLDSSLINTPISPASQFSISHSTVPQPHALATEHILESSSADTSAAHTRTSRIMTSQPSEPSSSKHSTHDYLRSALPYMRNHARLKAKPPDGHICPYSTALPASTPLYHASQFRHPYTMTGDSQYFSREEMMSMVHAHRPNLQVPAQFDLRTHTYQDLQVLYTSAHLRVPSVAFLAYIRHQGTPSGPLCTITRSHGLCTVTHMLPPQVRLPLLHTAFRSCAYPF